MRCRCKFVIPYGRDQLVASICCVRVRSLISLAVGLGVGCGWPTHRTIDHEMTAVCPYLVQQERRVGSAVVLCEKHPPIVMGPERGDGGGGAGGTPIGRHVLLIAIGVRNGGICELFKWDRGCQCQCCERTEPSSPGNPEDWEWKQTVR